MFTARSATVAYSISRSMRSTGHRPRGAWLRAADVDDKVVVIGFSYQRGGHRVGAFRNQSL